MTKFTPVSLARFVEEKRVRKGAKKGKWRRHGREADIVPHILAQSDADAHAHGVTNAEQIESSWKEKSGGKGTGWQNETEHWKI